MRKYTFLARIAACAAGFGLLLPTGALQAGELPVTQSVRQVASDVVLTNGTLTGQFITANGAAVEGAKVSVRHAGREVLSTTTDAKGVFVAPGLQNGVYEIAAGNQVELVRAWDNNAAPPAAKNYATIITNNAIRGQSCDSSCGGSSCGGSDALVWTAVGLGVAGLAVGIIALTEDDDSQIIVVSP